MMPQARNLSNSHDVLVAGAGPVGLVLALALGRRGFDVGVIDPAPAASSRNGGGRAYFIAHGCWRIFVALGLAQALEGAAQPVEEVSARGAGARPGGGAAFLASDTGGDGPLGRMIRETDLLAELEAAVDAEAGVSLLRGVTMSDAAFSDPKAVVLTSAGEIAASLIVGCDGARSAVRTSADVRFEGRDYPAKAVSAIVRLDRPHGGAARQVFLPRGPLAVLPLRDDRANLVWTNPARVADALAAMSDQDFAVELARQSEGFVGGFTLEGPRTAFPIGVRIAERFHGPRFALAGDAAHLVHPLAGQGLNLGLKDVAALVDVVADAARVGLDIGAETALAPYSRWRRSDVVATAAAMEAFARTFGAPAPVRAVAGVAMAAAGAIAPLRRLFAAEAGGTTGEPPSLMRAQTAASPHAG